MEWLEIVENLRRARDYHPREKWIVFGGLAVITLILWAMNGPLFLGAPISSQTISVTNLSAPETINVEEEGIELAVVQLTDKRTNQPATGVWVGLRINDTTKRSPNYTYHDWYSPKAGRAFYPTNSAGEVYFPLASELGGEVEYEVFVGDPESTSYRKYQRLDAGFRVNYN